MESVVSDHALPARLWTLSETAQYLGISMGTLYQFNHKGIGPVFFRVGKYCRYDPRDVLVWLSSRRSTGGD